jgi:hypothetical protein
VRGQSKNYLIIEFENKFMAVDFEGSKNIDLDGAVKVDASVADDFISVTKSDGSSYVLNL